MTENSKQVALETCPIYVTSRASIPERGAMWRKFRDEGVRITSSWIDEDGEGQTADFSELWLRVTNEIREAAAVVLYAEADDFPLKGAFIEAGIALGMGKPVIACLPDLGVLPRNYRPIGSWITHPLVTRCDLINKAVWLATHTRVSTASAAPLVDDAGTCGSCKHTGETNGNGVCIRSTLSDDGLHVEICGCKCVAPAPLAAPVGQLIDREEAAKMAFDAIQAALQGDWAEHYSVLQVAGMVAANVRRITPVSTSPATSDAVRRAAEEIDEYYDDLVGFNIRVMGAEEVTTIISKDFPAAAPEAQLNDAKSERKAVLELIERFQREPKRSQGTINALEWLRRQIEEGNHAYHKFEASTTGFGKPEECSRCGMPGNALMHLLARPAPVVTEEAIAAEHAGPMPRLPFICDNCFVQQYADGIRANCGAIGLRSQSVEEPTTTLHCSCGAACTPEEYEVHRAMGHDAAAPGKPKECRMCFEQPCICPTEACKYCGFRDCQCSDFDVSPDMGAK